MKYLKLSLTAVAVVGLNGCFLEGDNGQIGMTGKNSLVIQSDLAIGNANCPNSGLQFNSGIDTNVSGSLESSEIINTNYVCAPSLLSVSSTQLLSSLNNDWFIEAAALVSQIKYMVKRHRRCQFTKQLSWRGASNLL